MDPNGVYVIIQLDISRYVVCQIVVKNSIFFIDGVA